MAEREKPVLLVDDVSVTYRTHLDVGYGLRKAMQTGFSGRATKEVAAVRGVSFQMNEGEVLGIVGSNGAGKSTLLTSIAGLLPVTSGRIYASSQPVLLGVGAALRSGVSGRRNIRIGLLALGFVGEEMDDMVEQIIDFADIGSAIDRPMGTYSSGMRARVSFGIATCIRPRMLLIDEALAVGDKKFKSKSYAKIEELRDTAGSIIFVSHSLTEVRRICSRVIWLVDGKIVSDGPAEQVLAEYEAS